MTRLVVLFSLLCGAISTSFANSIEGYWKAIDDRTGQAVSLIAIKKMPDGTFFGKSQVDASDRREVTFKDDTKLATTCLLRGEFDILAVNCYAFDNEWRFAFARNDQLPQNTYKKYSEAQKAALLPTLIPVTWPPQAPFSEEPFSLLDALVRERETGKIPEVPEPPVKSVDKG